MKKIVFKVVVALCTFTLSQNIHAQDKRGDGTEDKGYTGLECGKRYRTFILMAGDAS